MTEKSKSTLGEMSLGNHFNEMRKRLFYAVLGILSCTIASYVYWREIWIILQIPITTGDVKIYWQALTPVEVFSNSIKVALIAGILTSSPFTLWCAWRFLAPGLFIKEKKLILPVLIASLLLFLGGAAFCFLVVLPFGMRFLINYTPQDISANWTMGAYSSFILKILVSFGLAFELPVVSYVFTKLGLITWRMLRASARYAIVIIVLASALLTPPDPITQIMLAIPLCLIYGVSIVVSWMVNKDKEEEDEDEDEENEEEENQEEEKEE